MPVQPNAGLLGLQTPDAPPIPQQPQSGGGIGGLLGGGFDPQAAYLGPMSDPATQQAMRQRAMAAIGGAMAQGAVTPYRSGALGFMQALGRAGEAGYEAMDQMQATRLQAAQGQNQLAQAEYQRATMQAAQQQMALNRALVEEMYGGGGAGGGTAPIGSGAAGAAGPGKLPAPGKDPRNKIPVIRAAAIANGIDPDVAVAVAGTEGLGTFLGDHGKSGGSFQLYTGGGMGNDFQRDMHLDPLDPANEDATINYAMQRAAKEGWGAWNGAKRIGITGFYGIGGKPGATQVAGGAPGTTGTTGPAQAPTTAGAPDQAPAAQPGLVTQGQVKPWRAIGDSLAGGYVRFGGMQGSMGSDAVNGRDIPGNLAYVKSLPTGSLNGQPVMLSTGLSNSVVNGHPEEINQIPEMLGELKRAGAGPIRVVGVGTVAGQERGMAGPVNLAPYNAQLQKLVEANGATFQGGIPRAVVHPHTSYYTQAGAPPQEGAAPGSPARGPAPPPPPGLPPGAAPTALPQPPAMQAPGLLAQVPQAGAAMAQPIAPQPAARPPAPGGQGGLLQGIPPQAPAPPPIPPVPANLVPGRAAQGTVAAAGGPQPVIPPPTPRAPMPAPAAPPPAPAPVPGPQGGPPAAGTPPAATPVAQTAPAPSATPAGVPRGMVPEPTAGMQPGGAGQIPGAPSQRAIQLANASVALSTAYRLPINPLVQKIAEFPLLGPTAAATSAGQEAGAMPYKLLFEQLKPQLLRQGSIVRDPQTGQIYGNPGKVELTDAQGNKTSYFLGFGPDGKWMVQPIGQTEIGPGVKTGLEGVAKTTVEQRDQVMKDGAIAPVLGAQLRLIRSEAPSFYTGSFAEYRHDWDKLLVSMGLDNSDPRAEGVAGYESVNKQLGSLVREQAKATSQRAGVQELKLVGASMPNVEMSARGLDRTLAELQGLNDYRMAKMQAMSQWRVPGAAPGDTTGFEADFNQKVSPYAFIYHRMSKADQDALVARVGQTDAGKAELGRLSQQLKYLDAQGLSPQD